MMNLKIHVMTVFVVSFAALMSPLALAQSPAPVDSTKAQKDQSEPLVKGEIRKLDKATGKLTIKHGPILHLDMPPMTMVFHAANPTSLEALKIGDQVEFTVSNDNGKMSIKTIVR